MTVSVPGIPLRWPAIPPEKPDIRLVAIDLDDTMLTDDLRITPRTKEAIQAARRQGVVVTIATGRMFESALLFARQLALDCPLITYQGALVKTPDGRVVGHYPMDPTLSAEVLDLLLSFHHHVTVYLGDKLYLEKTSPETEYYRSRIRIPFNEVESLRALLAESGAGATKMVLMANAAQVREVMDAVESRFGTRIQAMPSKPTFLELSRPDVGKGVALADMAKSMGIGRLQVMAIGDSPNDLDMIEYAGWGVAMANGTDSIKAKADWITASNNDEGVAIALETLVLK